jgi:hypothetical protein
LSWVRTLSSALNLAKDASPLHKKTFAMNLLRCMPNHNLAQMNEMALDLSQGVLQVQGQGHSHPDPQH